MGENPKGDGMILLLAYASVAVVMIGVQCYVIGLDTKDSCDPAFEVMAWLVSGCVSGAFWPITLSYHVSRWLSSRPPACACGLRARKGGRFCARCGSKIGATIWK